MRAPLPERSQRAPDVVIGFVDFDRVNVDGVVVVPMLSADREDPAIEDGRSEVSARITERRAGAEAARTHPSEAS